MPKYKLAACWGGIMTMLATCASGQGIDIRLDAADPGRPVSPYLTGACIEDVNHEIYGGIYSQMLFGESFQEPPTGSVVKGFAAADGQWRAQEGELRGDAGPGPKLIDTTNGLLADGEVGVEVYLPGSAADADGKPGVSNAGLILRVNRAGAGADNFDGYEIALDPRRRVLMLGRHQHNYRSLAEVACDVATDRWIALAVRMTKGTIEARVDGRSVLTFTDDRPLKAGVVGLRQWKRPARYRNLWMKTGEARIDLPFEPPTVQPATVSGMWGPTTRGTALLAAEIVTAHPFIGTQSQRVTFISGAGETGLENRGLNHQGLCFVVGKPYEGYLWLRAEKPTEVYAALETGDGARTAAEARVDVAAGDWRRYDFTLTPDAADVHGRFVVKLKSPGSVDIGHAFLQPGQWGRYKGLPLRRDVAEGLIDQRVIVLRYGGSMVNAPEYRWKKMTGPRDHRPPYKGTWYAYSTNGWGIIDFLDLCEAAGIQAIPDFNADETPQDMANFVEYVNGPAESEWGRRRAADGHPAPYGLKYLELGNEERVDETYFGKFSAVAKAVWAKDPQVTLVVGDFAYDQLITDPDHITGAASKLTDLAAHRKILELARQAGREVWFDIHLWTDGPGPSPSLKALPSYVEAIEKLSGGAKHKVVVFELNSGNHRQRRALANAVAIGVAERDGRIPVVTAANCLQPDGQNDNGWDQGLLFLNPSGVWLQPPGYVTQLIARSAQPRVLDVTVEAAGDTLDVTATRSDDGRAVVLRVVNLSDQPRPARLRIDHFVPSSPEADVDVLAGPLDARNTANDPTHIQPAHSKWPHGMKDGAASFNFSPHSLTTIRFE